MVMINPGSRGPRSYDRSSTSSADGSEVAALGALGLAGWSVFSLFGLAPVFAVALLGFVAALVVLLGGAGNRIRNETFVVFLLLGDGALALAATPLVFFFHVVPYTVMAGFITGAYWLALFAGLWSALRGALKFFAGLLAVATVAAVVILPAPEAAAGHDDASKWSVKVTVVDTDSVPIDGALAQCTTVMVWEQGKPLKVKPKLMKATSADGKASFTFHSDTRLKAAMCGALKPSTPDQQGYKLRTGIVLNPLRGGEFPLTIALDERTPAGSDSAEDYLGSAPADACGADCTVAACDKDCVREHALAHLPPDIAAAAEEARSAAERAQASAAAATQAAAEADNASREAENAAQLASAAADRASVDAPGTHYYATSDGYAYSGEYSGDQRNGYGVATWSAPSSFAGFRYAGGWSSGERAGYGVATFEATANVERYAGGYANGDWSGYGVARFRNGTSYAGSVQGGKRNGSGVYSYSDGGSTAGDWVNDSRSGFAVQTLSDGEDYSGAFLDGYRAGFGVYRFASGARFEGRWSNGQRNGPGVTWGPDGRPSQSGYWRNGDYIGTTAP